MRAVRALTTQQAEVGRRARATFHSLALCGAVLVAAAVASPVRAGPVAKSATWTVQTVSPTQGVLSGVSCSTVSACTAVGYEQASTGVASGVLVESWTGGRWRPAGTPKLAVGANLSAVSCPVAGWCMAVGQSGGWPLALVLKGGNWEAVSVRHPVDGTQGQLSDVSCPVAGACVAVGTWLDAANFNSGAMAYSFKRSVWVRAALPSPVAGAGLNGVSCVPDRRPADCTAVGSHIMSGVPVPLVLHGAGARWAIVKVPAGPRGVPTTLNSVSCPQKGRCMAAGKTDKDNVTTPFVVVERHQLWARLAGPKSTTESNYLSVSCAVTITWCALVGDKGTGDGLVAIEVWAGHWQAQTAPVPAGLSQLLGVACRPVHHARPTCRAVGFYRATTGSADRLLVLRRG